MIAERPNVQLEGRYNIKEAAALLGVSRSTVRRHYQSGHLKFGCRRYTGAKFFTGRELIRYWEAQL